MCVFKSRIVTRKRLCQNRTIIFIKAPTQMNRKKFYFLSWEEVVTMLTRFCFIPISNWVATYIYDKGFSIVWKPFSHVNKKSRHYCCVGEKLNIKVGWLLSKLCCLDMSLTFVAKMGEVFRGPGFSSRLPKNDEKTFFPMLALVV